MKLHDVVLGLALLTAGGAALAVPMTWQQDGADQGQEPAAKPEHAARQEAAGDSMSVLHARLLEALAKGDSETVAKLVGVDGAVSLVVCDGDGAFSKIFSAAKVLSFARAFGRGGDRDGADAASCIRSCEVIAETGPLSVVVVEAEHPNKSGETLYMTSVVDRSSVVRGSGAEDPSGATGLRIRHLHLSVLRAADAAGG